MHRGLAWMASIGFGAVMMYVLDPADGRRRRASLRDQAASVTRRSGRSVRRLGHDWRNRASGVVARMRSHGRVVDDAVVEARVRSALGRVCSHPGAVAVASVDGIVELNGPVLAREYDELIDEVERTPGVLAVVDHMSQHDDASNVPGLQGEGSVPEASRGWPVWAMGTACSAAALLFYAAAYRTDRSHGTVVGQDDSASS